MLNSSWLLWIPSRFALCKEHLKDVVGNSPPVANCVAGARCRGAVIVLSPKGMASRSYIRTAVHRQNCGHGQ